MNQETQDSGRHFGLLACGSSRRWRIDIDESLAEPNELFAQIEGPGIYIDFKLRDSKVVSEVLRFLQRGPQEEHPLTIGWFAAKPVELIWDNELPPRCFLVVGPPETGCLRVDLGEDDIRMLIEALHQVADDLADTSDQ